MSMAPIDKDIPIWPAHSRPGPRKRRWPWRTMEVGDSFLATGVAQERMGTLAGAVYLRSGKKFETRRTDDGVRVWRMA